MWFFWLPFFHRTFKILTSPYLQLCDFRFSKACLPSTTTIPHPPPSSSPLLTPPPTTTRGTTTVIPATTTVPTVTPTRSRRRRTTATTKTTLSSSPTTKTTINTTFSSPSTSSTSAQISHWFENRVTDDTIKIFKNNSMVIDATPVVRDVVDYHSSYTNLVNNLMIGFTQNNRRHFLLILILFFVFLFFAAFIIVKLIKLERYYRRNLSPCQDHGRLDKNEGKKYNHKTRTEHRTCFDDHLIKNLLDHDIPETITFSSYIGPKSSSPSPFPTVHTEHMSTVGLYDNLP